MSNKENGLMMWMIYKRSDENHVFALERIERNASCDEISNCEKGMMI